MDEKACIVLPTPNPRAGMAETCRAHSPAPRTAYGRKEKLLAGGRISLDGPDASKQAKRRKKEIASLRRIIGGRAPAEAAGIEMRGHNRCLTLTQNAAGAA